MPWARIVHRRVLSGSAIARFLGTNSPSTICTTAATAMATNQVTVEVALGARPAASATGSSSRPIVGSASTPRAMLLAVIPSWAPETCKRRF